MQLHRGCQTVQIVVTHINQGHGRAAPGEKIPLPYVSFDLQSLGHLLSFH